MASLHSVNYKAALFRGYFGRCFMLSYLFTLCLYIPAAELPLPMAGWLGAPRERHTDEL